MNNKTIFPLSLDFEGRHYSGEIIPSEEKQSNGMPAYFKVTMGNEIFTELYCGADGWQERNGNGQLGGVVTAIGSYILDYYE